MRIQTHLIDHMKMMILLIYTKKKVKAVKKLRKRLPSMMKIQKVVVLATIEVVVTFQKIAVILTKILKYLDFFVATVSRYLRTLSRKIFYSCYTPVYI